MNNFYEKHEDIVCYILIIIYILINMFSIDNFGIVDYRSSIINTLLSLFIILYIIKLKKLRYYGLIKVENTKDFLYFIPLLFIISTNLWNGININNNFFEIICFIITMINIGFLEEIIFRGFLFRMLEKENLKLAIVVSSITFGVGHIINLFNGAALIPTFLQICYATSIGFLFVTIFYKSNSLLPCIITHSLVNALSIFNIENNLSMYISSVFLIIVPLIYTIYLNKIKV